MRRVLLHWARFEVVAAAILISLAVACYPGEITNVQQTDLVTTLYRKDAAWGSFDTIVVLDTVVHIVLEGQEEIEISRDYDPQIINLVRDGFTDYGYTLIDQDAVDPNDPPQAFAFIQATAAENTVYWQSWGGWWGYWGWYPGWPGWGPGWGWYYPPVWGSSTYYTGSIFVDMIDGRNSTADTLFVLWSSTLNGLLANSTAQTSTRINDGLTQAFAQSPYLQAN
jgi:hypothetical protein